MDNGTPLAEKMRPTKLDDVFGQDHLIGPGKILSEIVKNGRPVSLILWGPAGSGKTTLARIMADELDAQFVELSAVTSGKADVNRVIESAKINRRLGQATILFVDEIHRFNKAQQDAFLPHVEDGTIALIGATTENPSYEVIGPLISRTRVLLLEALDDEAIEKIVKKASKELKLTTKKLSKKSLDALVELAGGDARIALGNLELASQLAQDKITPEIIEKVANRSPKYDKASDQHYNTISAFIKSMRGSDPKAACYYLARMIRGGEDPKFIARRMVVFASEDIGLKAPAALNLAVSTFQAVEQIGMPECEHNLYHCAIVLAKAEKSRQVVEEMAWSKSLAEKFPDSPVPFHLQSKLMRRAKDKATKKPAKHNKSTYSDGYLPADVEKFLDG